MLVENDMIIIDKKQIPNIINEHFVGITKKLSLKPSISLKDSDCVDVYLVHLTNSVNHSLQTSVFPQKLKQAKVIQLYQKLDPLNKENYSYAQCSYAHLAITWGLFIAPVRTTHKLLILFA